MIKNTRILTLDSKVLKKWLQIHDYWNKDQKFEQNCYKYTTIDTKLNDWLKAVTNTRLLTLNWEHW